MNGSTIVSATRGGKSFRCSVRTLAHIDATLDALDAKDGYTRSSLYIIQPSYNTGVSASAGTHDRDAVFDVVIWGMDWWAQQRFFREQGWAAWYRYPPLFSAHIHMASIGTPADRLGVYVPGQISDYYNSRNGLAGHSYDGSWRPANIDATVFRMRKGPEMAQIEDEDFERIRRIVNSELHSVETSVSKMRQGTYERDRELLKVLANHFTELEAAVGDSDEGLREKINKSRERTVGAFRRLVEQ